MKFARTLASFLGATHWPIDLFPLRTSKLREVFGNCENPVNVGKSEDSALSVAGHLGVFAGLESPTKGVGVEAQEGAEVPRPIVILLRDSKPVTLGR